MRHLRIVGILDRLNLLNKVWLSPESDDADRMIRLAESIRRRGYRILNMFFHSTTLEPGLTHFTKSGEDVEELNRRIERFLEYAGRAGIRSITLSESLKVCAPEAAAG